MKDPLGEAVFDYLNYGKETSIIIQSPDFEDDIILTKYFFRTYSEMPKAEQKAINLAKGKILDVGAGAGCHSLELQKLNFEVKAIDISPLACKTMKQRGVSNVSNIAFSNLKNEKFDTILFLMNGIGIEGGIENIPKLFNQLKKILNKGGQVLFDSSDLKFLYENEYVEFNEKYYGEFQFKMKYKETEGDYFDWLYIDPYTMNYYAKKNGFKFKKIYENDHYSYLAKLNL